MHRVLLRASRRNQVDVETADSAVIDKKTESDTHLRRPGEPRDSLDTYVHCSSVRKLYFLAHIRKKKKKLGKRVSKR